MKLEAEKLNGLKCKYFVLNPKSKTPEDAHASASRAAILEYAMCIVGSDPILANNLIEWAEKEFTLAMEMKNE